MDDPSGHVADGHGRGRIRAGILYALASGACFGTMPIFARLAYRSGVDVSTLLLLRFSFGAACLWLMLLRRGLAAPRGRALALLALMGVGYAAQAFCYLTAITMASAGLVSLLLYLYPAMVAVLARLVFQTRLSAWQWSAVAVALAGSALTIGKAGDGRPLGIALGVLAAAVYSCYILIGSRIPAAVTPVASTAVILTGAAAVYAVAGAARGLRLPTGAAGWGAVLGVAVVCTVMAITFFFEGMERVGPVRASVYSTVELLVTLTLAALVLGEPVSLTRGLGGILIVTAVIVLAREELRAARAAA